MQIKHMENVLAIFRAIVKSFHNILCMQSTWKKKFLVKIYILVGFKINSIFFSEINFTKSL